jgi:hypothetical protein
VEEHVVAWLFHRCLTGCVGFGSSPARRQKDAEENGVLNCASVFGGILICMEAVMHNGTCNYSAGSQIVIWLCFATGPSAAKLGHFVLCPQMTSVWEQNENASIMNPGY